MSKPISQEDIERVAAQLTAGQKVKLNLKPEETGLLVVDVQDEFCNPASHHRRGTEETVKTAQNIARLLPVFRTAGVKIYFVKTNKTDFFAVKPEDGDQHIYKSSDGAFAGSRIKDILLRDGKKNLLVCGFNLSACVRRTALGGIENGFRVCIPADMVGNDVYHPSVSAAAAYLKGMIDEGVIASKSKRVLCSLRRYNQIKARATAA